jgi:hypothetical protein
MQNAFCISTFKSLASIEINGGYDKNRGEAVLELAYLYLAGLKPPSEVDVIDNSEGTVPK